MRRVFIDTSAFFALIAREDPNHVQTRELFEQAARESWSLVTTNAVAFEAHALVLNRAQPGRIKAQFLQIIETDTYQVVRVKRADEEKAIAIIRAHQDKSYSLCDTLSFVVMERLRIRDAISFDQDFRSYGRFTLL